MACLISSPIVRTATVNCLPNGAQPVQNQSQVKIFFTLRLHVTSKVSVVIKSVPTSDLIKCQINNTWKHYP